MAVSSLDWARVASACRTTNKYKPLTPWVSLLVSSLDWAHMASTCWTTDASKPLTGSSCCEACRGISSKRKGKASIQGWLRALKDNFLNISLACRKACSGSSSATLHFAGTRRVKEIRRRPKCSTWQEIFYFTVSVPNSWVPWQPQTLSLDIQKLCYLQPSAGTQHFHFSEILLISIPNVQLPRIIFQLHPSRDVYKPVLMPTKDRASQILHRSDAQHCKHQFKAHQVSSTTFQAIPTTISWR
eukprot:1161723-Pelagomonas_calceolata.AAC.4